MIHSFFFGKILRDSIRLLVNQCSIRYNLAMEHGTITQDNHAALWHGRFKEGPDAEAVAFETSINVDERMALDDIKGSRAHAKMLGHTAENRLFGGRHSFFYRSDADRPDWRAWKKTPYRKKPQ